MNGRNDLRELVEPWVVGDASRYLRRLIIEAPYIMARLYNPGGSVLLLPTNNGDQITYGSDIGNDAHLDLIEASVVLQRDFSKGERDTLIDWALGFTSQQAAEYNSVKPSAIRKRRERVIGKMETKLHERSLGGRGDSDTAGGGEGIVSTQTGNLGREAIETRTQERDIVRGDSREEAEAQ